MKHLFNTTRDSAEMFAEIAFDFARRVRETIGADDWREMQRRNREDSGYGDGACASHDFCDANVYLNDAIRQAFPAYAAADDSALTDQQADELRDALADVWNPIHAIATRAYFTAHDDSAVTIDRMDSVTDHRDILATAYAVREADMLFTRLEFSESLAASIGDDCPAAVYFAAMERVGRFMLGPMLSMRDNCAPSDSVDIDGADCPLFIIYGAREIAEGVAA